MPNINLSADRINILQLKEKAVRSKSVSAVKPELVTEWNYEKNGTLTPDNLHYGSG